MTTKSESVYKPRGILYDEVDGGLLFGSKALYSAFNFMLHDRLRNHHLTDKEHTTITNIVKGLFNEMWMELRKGSIWQRIIYNWGIIEDYRRRLKEEPHLEKYVKEAESLLMYK